MKTGFLEACRSLAVLGVLVACTGLESGPDAGPPPQVAGARQAAAVTLVAGARPVRWISPRELCVVPYDARDLEVCRSLARRSLARRSLAPEVHQRIRRAIPEAVADSAGRSGGIACVRVSREIPVGDSVLVVVGTVGSAVADGFAESTSRWVWFRRSAGATGARVRVTHSPYNGTSDVEPITDPSRC